jgi:hypothetical protein
MTSEIIIMNREAVALAADSSVALTIGNNLDKTFTSANKIHRLSNAHPIGIMIYNCVNFIETPWESIIKVFRNNCNDQESDDNESLFDYADKFLSFLSTTPLISELQERDYFKKILGVYCENYLEDINSRVKQVIENQNEVSIDDIIDIALTTITEKIHEWQNKPIHDCFIDINVQNDIFNHYENTISILLEEIFQEMFQNSDIQSKLIILAKDIIFRFSVTDIASGIIIVGFGGADIFPALMEFEIYGRLKQILVYKEIEKKQVSHEFSNRAVIEPYAQKDVIETILNGIEPSVNDYLSSLLLTLIDSIKKMIYIKLDVTYLGDLDAVMNDISLDINRKIQSYHTNLNQLQVDYKAAINYILDILPKDELASMAESLINITSIMRKVTPGIETVGGPVDVAIITKGDGFIWVKRKYYFEIENNPQYVSKYISKELVQ